MIYGAAGQRANVKDWRKMFGFAEIASAGRQTQIRAFVMPKIAANLGAWDEDSQTDTRFTTPSGGAARKGKAMSDNPMCQCGHRRSEHDEEQPYRCQGDFALGEDESEPCECDSFDYPVETK